MTEPRDERPIAAESVYIVRGRHSTAAVARSLRALLSTHEHPILPHRFTLLDTFDARVRRAGARLTQSGPAESPTIDWQPAGRRGRVRAQLARPAAFAWEVPDGPLRDALSPVVGVRRLFAQADAEAHGTVLDIVDGRRKTVARVRIESGQARLPSFPSAWHELPTTVTLASLQGYEEAYKRLVPIVESRPGLSSCPEGVDALMLRRIGAPERGDLSSPHLTLPFDVGAADGARQIHRALVANLTANEPGLRANFDTEFLHDFRVALRRTRSLLGQIKDVFPAAVVEHFSREFSWIGRAAGPPRDLDVLALALRDLRDDIPAEDAAAVAAFLAELQEREHRSLIDALDSPRYQALVSDWEAFLSQPMAPDAQLRNARRPLKEIVARRAWRLSRRIADSADMIDNWTATRDIHGVRIDAKKLRYLIDMTPAFFDTRDLTCILSALKKLQRVLGDFNDAQVQEARLVECGRALGAAGGPAGALLAFGRLAEERRHRRETLRAEVIERLSRFRDTETRQACKRAFKHASAAQTTR